MTKPNIYNLYRTQLSEKYFINNYPEYRDYLNTRWPDILWKDKLYLDQHGMDHIPLCPICGNPVKLITLFKGYSSYCSPRCASKGDKWDKFSKTMKNRYGCEHPLQNKDILKKQQQTCIDRYGVENYSSTTECKEKVKSTCIDRYGEEYRSQFSYKGAQTRRLRTETISDRPDRIWYDNIERFIKNILDEHNISYKTNVRDIISPKELDIYIPDKNIAIECNGIYWHSQYDREYHVLKYHQCESAGIQLLSIWEDWIYTKPDIVRSIILSKLGIYQKRIYARSCDIISIDSQTYREFLDLNHIQGSNTSTYRYGLIYKGELVAVMGFCRKRGCMGNKQQNPDIYELSRFCSKINTQVIGAAERLLKKFQREVRYTKIYSFSCNDISNGSLYKVLNFKYVDESFNYWYIDSKNKKRYHRVSFTKSKIVKLGWKETIDNTWTEAEVTKEHGLFRIYDSGMKKWEIYEKNT